MMIAIGTSSLRRYLAGARGADVAAVERALEDEAAWLPPPVLTEILSEPSLTPEVVESLLRIPLLEIDSDFWRRAGILRSKLLAQGRKAKLADCFIAQSCIDHGAALITHDRDFRHFAPYGLELV
jgi:predicted nucleic acid-binding protein